jgi:hypothetical protein
VKETVLSDSVTFTHGNLNIAFDIDVTFKMLSNEFGCCLQCYGMCSCCSTHSKDCSSSCHSRAPGKSGTGCAQSKGSSFDLPTGHERQSHRLLRAQPHQIRDVLPAGVADATHMTDTGHCCCLQTSPVSCAYWSLFVPV